MKGFPLLENGRKKHNSVTIYLKVNGYTFTGINSYFHFSLPFPEGSTLKEKNLLSYVVAVLMFYVHGKQDSQLT